MTPAERHALEELYEPRWQPFDLAAIEAELNCLVEQRGAAVTVADLGQVERVAA